MLYTPKNVGPYGDHLMVFLNDKLLNIDRIAYVDDTIGEVKRYLLNEKGDLYLDYETKEIAYEVLTGRVDVLIKSNAPEEVKQYFIDLQKEQP